MTPPKTAVPTAMYARYLLRNSLLASLAASENREKASGVVDAIRADLEFFLTNNTDHHTLDLLMSLLYCYVDDVLQAGENVPGALARAQLLEKILNKEAPHDT